LTSTAEGRILAAENTGVFSRGRRLQQGFSSAVACRTVGVSPRQIQYWDEIGLVKPSATPAAGRGTRRRYSFLDLVRLSVVRSLIERGLRPREIRKSLAALREAYPRVLDPLAELKLVTDGERLFLVTADRRRILDVLERQFVFSIALGPMVRELRGRVDRLALRPGAAPGPVRCARGARLARWKRRVG
jgi:DNA-binding transcriptional MerR regulator